MALILDPDHSDRFSDKEIRDAIDQFDDAKIDKLGREMESRILAERHNIKLLQSETRIERMSDATPDSIRALFGQNVPKDVANKMQGQAIYEQRERHWQTVLNAANLVKITRQTN
jgi:hypothetical protein